MRIAFAGDREIAVKVLDHIASTGVEPLALLLASEKKASHFRHLYVRSKGCCTMRGTEFRTERGIELLKSLDLDYLICVHFPYLVPKEVLDIPKYGVVNLHPSFLPYNRGWHTPSWALWNGTPAGATLHYMDEGVDTGSIIHQKQTDIRPDDTADSLYQRMMETEFEVFNEAWPLFFDGKVDSAPQPKTGVVWNPHHLKLIQQLGQKEQNVVGRLRALTTNKVSEAAWFEENGVRYRVQVKITPEVE